MKCPTCGKSLWFVRDACVFCKTKLTAPPRPKSVTVVSWLVIISGVGTAFFLSTPAAREFMAKAREQHPITSIITYLDVALRMICGTLMLRGVNWARWTLGLVLGYGVVSHLGSASRNLAPAYLGQLVWFAVVVYYLFRPAAKAFFTGSASVVLKLPEGQARCNECGELFAANDMIRHGSLHVCAACKPRFMQKLSEGAQANGMAKPGS